MYDNSYNPYTPPASSIDGRVVYREGSFGLGFVLGFLLGLWGWLGCLVLAKAETKRGSGYGFLSRVGLGVVVAVIAVVAG